MDLLQSLLFGIVSFGASIIGAICGIGGGVIIKPVLDVFGWASVSTISFLSGCTVLSMSCYNVLKGMMAGDSKVNAKTGTPLAIGAAAGGIVGNQLFAAIRRMFENPNTVGAVQAGCLALITLGTLVYTVNKSKIKTHCVTDPVTSALIGLLLGIISSFLGIGGGPINLVVLYYFYSMQTKTAAANSLYIILYSQLASLAMTVITRSIPDFTVTTLVVMVMGGIGGGMVGRSLNKKLNNKAVETLFVGLMLVIVAISIYNVFKYTL